MKTKKSFIYLFLLLTFISCKKDIKTNAKFKSIDFDSKTAFTNYKSFKNYALKSTEEGILKSSNAGTVFNSKSEFTIIENIYYESSAKEYSFVEFQIEYKYKNGLLPNKANDATDKARIDATIDRLLIKKNKKSGIIDYELVSYIPNIEALNSKLLLANNKHNDLLSDFNGHIYHKNIGGETMYLEVIKNGLVSKKLYKAKNNTGLKVQSTNKENYEYCETYCIEGFVYDPSCYCYVVGSECFTDCYEVTNYPGVTIENGVISFDSNQSFYDTFMSLDDAVEQHNANFYDSKGNLTDEQIENVEAQQNFDEFKPLRDFKTYFGFASLRQKIEDEENLWLENNTLNPATDPDFLYTKPDDVMRTFFNQNQSLKIAGIYASTPSDGVLETHAGGSTSECRTHDRYKTENNANLYDNGNKSAKFVASFNGFYLGVAGTRIVARTKNYKKKSNGNWKKFATSCIARIGGQVVDANCFNNVSFEADPKGYQRRRSYKTKKISSDVPRYIRQNEMGASHNVGDILYFQRNFTW